MDQELNSDGICSTCNFRSECLSYKNSKKLGRPVLHCEEFDDSVASVVEKKQQMGPLTEGNESKGDALANSAKPRGLCMNCDDAEICKFAGFGDDVVFCEEHSSNFDNER